MPAFQKASYPIVQWAVGRMLDFVARSQRKRQSRRELDALMPNERSVIAADLGLTELQLRRLASQDNAFPEMLKQMLTALEIADVDLSADPPLSRDMQALCSVCDHKRKCRRELRNGRAARFRSFCPNASNLEWLSRTGKTPLTALRSAQGSLS